MRFRGFVALACAAVLSLSIAGCCCPPKRGGETKDDFERIGGPTLRPGFVRITRNAETNAVAYYATDIISDSTEYWITPAANFPVSASAGDTLHYEFLDAPHAKRLGSPADLCQWYEDHWSEFDTTKFSAPKVHTVVHGIAGSMLCGGE